MFKVHSNENLFPEICLKRRPWHLPFWIVEFSNVYYFLCVTVISFGVILNTVSFLSHTLLLLLKHLASHFVVSGFWKAALKKSTWESWLPRNWTWVSNTLSCQTTPAVSWAALGALPAGGGSPSSPFVQNWWETHRVLLLCWAPQCQRDMDILERI